MTKSDVWRYVKTGGFWLTYAVLMGVNLYLAYLYISLWLCFENEICFVGVPLKMIPNNMAEECWVIFCFLFDISMILIANYYLKIKRICSIVLLIFPILVHLICY